MSVLRGWLAGVAATVRRHCVNAGIPNIIVGQEMNDCWSSLEERVPLAERGPILTFPLGILLLVIVSNGLTLLGISTSLVQRAY